MTANETWTFLCKKYPAFEKGRPQFETGELERFFFWTWQRAQKALVEQAEATIEMPEFMKDLFNGKGN